MLNKRILNNYEKITYERLDEVCKTVNASVFPKVRLADIFPITDSGISNEEYSFALKSHFDFTVYDNTTLQPLFAVEFDGKTHSTEVQKSRDKIKNRLAERFNLPLLRINSLYLDKKYRGLDLLSWCIEVWFSAEYFFEAQRNGAVPYDERFSPESIISISGYQKKFPFFLSFDIRNEVRKLFEAKKIKGSIPNVWIGTDNNKNYYGISWIHIDNNQWIVTTSGMKVQGFLMIQSDLLEEILIFELYNELSDFFGKKVNSFSDNEINLMINKFQKKYRLASASLGG